MKKIFIEILPSFLECSPSFIPTLRNRGYDVDYVYSEGSEASSREEFMRKFAGCDACILCIHHMTAEMMESAPNLKVIAVYGVGTDKIDIQAATKRGIAVVNAAGGNAVSVAEMTIGHMISLSRSIQRANIGMYTGIWKNYVGYELNGKTYGLLGMGAIGEQVARIAKNGFNMKVLAYDVKPRAGLEREYGIQYVDLNTLFSCSDYLSIHTPLLASTKGIVNRTLLKRMKPTAFLVNASRGGVLNEDDLLEALTKNWIAGAGLDVYENEPDSGERFGQFANVVQTCHMAGNTVDSIVRMGKSISENVMAVLEGGAPVRNLVNPDYRKY